MGCVEERKIAQHLVGTCLAIASVDANGLIELKSTGSATVLVNPGISVWKRNVRLMRGFLNFGLKGFAKAGGLGPARYDQLPGLRVAPAWHSTGKSDDALDIGLRHGIRFESPA